MAVKVRKQVYDLTADDLRLFPVWEFALDEESEDGQDEATVRPARVSEFAEKLDGSLVVSAEFELADGNRLPGYLTPRGPEASSLGELLPHIITDRGQVAFWHGLCPLDTSRLYELLKREPQSVFPIQFKTNMAIDRSEWGGEILGFMCLNNDFETVTIVR